MAFCPNCGTPNTDQAVKCVSCAFELAPGQKAKFKGTIMMSPVKAPDAPPGQPVPAPQAAPPAAAPAAAPAPARNMAFEKTMMGPMAGMPSLAAPPPPADPQGDLARAATVEGPAPRFTPPQATASAAPQVASMASAPAASIGGGYADSGYGNTGSGYGGGNSGGYDGDDGAPPTLPKPNTGKILAIGCAVVLVMSCLIGGVMYFMAKKQIAAIMGGGQDETATLAWRGTLSQALSKVSAECATDCQGAANYFHPGVQAALMEQAKQLTSVRVQKLVDPAQTEAAMLNTTDDSAIATNLALDPNLCVRIAGGNAKVVGCSVPNPSGSADMRIVHLSGIESL